MRHRPTQGKTTLRRLFLLTASVGLGVTGWFLLGELEDLTAEERPRPDVLARFEGGEVTENEVTELAASELAQLEQRRHELISETARKAVQSRLLAAEAERRGLTVEELLATEVDTEPHDPERREQTLDALISRLEDRYGVEYLVEAVARSAQQYGARLDDTQSGGTRLDDTRPAG